MTPTQKMKTTYLLLLSFVLLLSGCEITSSDLTEVDENGNRVNNKEIRIGASLLDVGMTAYTIDTVCTELILTRQKGGAVRISGFRKGTVIYDENGAIDSIAWDWRRPEINYGYDYRYVWDDLEYRILSLQDNGFVEDMEIWRRGKDGERERLVAQLSYSYDYAGYVSRTTPTASPSPKCNAPTPAPTPCGWRPKSSAIRGTSATSCVPWARR